MNVETELLREALASLPDPHFILSESGRYLAVLGGKDPCYYHDGSGLAGFSLHDVLPAEKADKLLEEIARSLREQRLCTIEYELSGDEVNGLDSGVGPAGKIRFEGRIQPLSSLFEGERAVVWVARNISHRYEEEARLRHMSETDSLTGLFNRRKLLSTLSERFHEYQRYGHPLAILMFDIDHFKQINDRFGHIIGDEVLRHISQVFTGSLRNVDLLARFGGEEFALLLPNTGLEQARMVAERLRQLVVQPPCCPTVHDLEVTISVGVSVVTAGDSGPQEVLKRADDALYEAKRSGKNRVAAAFS